MPLSVEELRSLRLSALKIVPADPGPVAGSVNGPDMTQRIAVLTESMLAMQGQDVGAVLWAIGLRTGATIGQVKAAFNQGEVIRSWPMRGTVHALRGADIGWIQSFTTPRLTGVSLQRRWDYLGLDAKTVEQVQEIATEVLVQKPMSRDEFFDAARARGVDATGPWRYHLVWYLAQTGMVCLGPFLPDKNEQALVLVDEWVPQPRAMEGDEALAQLVIRYLGAHGPATVKDLMWWVGLPQRDIKRGVAAAGDAVTTVAGADGAEYLVLAGLLDGVLGTGRALPSDAVTVGRGADHADGVGRALPSDAATDSGLDGSVHLLPAFDEHLLGYADRSAHLDTAQFGSIVATKNGIFKPTVVVDGVAIGMWSRVRKGGRAGAAGPVRVTVTPFDAVGANLLADVRIAAALDAAAQRYADFLEVPSADVEIVGV